MSRLKIFISYNSKNRRIVEILVNDLKMMGHEVWLDTEGITGGHKWWAKILEQIRQCDLFVPGLTTHYFKSVPCTREMDYAWSLQKCILPVGLADINHRTLPSSLQEIQITDYQHGSKLQLLRLVKSLNELPQPMPLPDPLPDEPEIPLHPIAVLRDKIDALPSNPDEQRLLVAHLKDLTEDEEYRLDAWELLEQLHDRENDLFKKPHAEIENILKNRPSRLMHEQHLATLEPRTFEGHKDAVNSVAFSPDGQYIVSGSKDFTARLWDTETGEAISIFDHAGAVSSVDISSDGKLLLTASEDRSLSLYSMKTREMVGRLEVESRLPKAVFSANGDRLLAITDYHAISVWDIKSGKQLTNQKLETDQTLTHISTISDSHLVAVAGRSGFACIYDFEANKEVYRLEGKMDSITCLDFSPDGKHVATVNDDKAIRLWDVETGELTHMVTTHPISARTVLFSHDCQYLVIGFVDGTVHYWNIKTNQMELFCQLENAIAESMALSPLDRYLLVGTQVLYYFLPHLVYLLETNFSE